MDETPEQPSTNPPDDAPSVAVQEAGIASVWINRDLSWLEFNRRVLAEAMDDRTPLLERVKFLAIFSANLDEFFMKRMAVLRENQGGHHTHLLEQMRGILEPMVRQQGEYFTGELVPALARCGIHLKRWEELSDSQRHEAGVFFDTQVSAALTPIAIHPTQPFPFFSNLSLSVAFVLHDESTGDTVDARVKVPAELRQWVELSTGVAKGEQLYTPLHEVIRENAHKLYPGMHLSAPTLFRVTRDAEVELDDDGEQSVRELVREQIRQRRYEPVVRLEFAANADPRLRQLLQRRFALADRELYELPGETDYSSLFEIAALDYPDLHDTPWTPIVPKRLDTDDSIFETLERGDLLVHHPYESFDESVEQFISAAADDPGTLAIKMTVYRVGDDTPFVRSLIRAAEAGKQVACVIELKARFDEKRNLHWAGELERAGAHVTVSGTKLKTHAKVALVVRQEPSGVRSYAHIGTGNYHVRTARLYTDVGLLTCHPHLTADISNLFHHLTGRSKALDFRTLLVAPGGMRQRFVELIAREAANQREGRPARIISQMNQLEDPAIIAALCDASRAGVSIDLIVRGLCCLRPGVEGVSETIRVRSVIGRFLEHSRIFYFAAGSHDPLDGDFLIGSADWMYRNLSRRVEVAAPVTAREPRERLWEILEVLLSDQRQAWLMKSDGTYVQLRPSTDTEDRSGTSGTHQALVERTQSRLSRDADDEIDIR